MNTNLTYDLDAIDNYKRYLSRIGGILSKHLEEYKDMQGYVQITSRFNINTYRAEVKIYFRTPKSSETLNFSRVLPLMLPEDELNQWTEAMNEKLDEVFHYVHYDEQEIDLEVTKETMKILKKQAVEQRKLIKIENQVKKKLKREQQEQQRQRKLDLSDISKYQDFKYKGLNLHPVFTKGNKVKYAVNDTPIWFSINTAYVNLDTMTLDTEEYNNSNGGSGLCVTFDDLLLMNINRFPKRFWDEDIVKFVEGVGNEHNS